MNQRGYEDAPGYNGPDDYLGTHANNDYVPSRLEIQKTPGELHQAPGSGWWARSLNTCSYARKKKAQPDPVVLSTVLPSSFHDGMQKKC